MARRSFSKGGLAKAGHAFRQNNSLISVKRLGGCPATLR